MLVFKEIVESVPLFLDAIPDTCRLYLEHPSETSGFLTLDLLDQVSLNL